ncbi:MAG: hypothetical protein J6U53_03585 [Tidjanibacter sp.]|nr:hypothetical protein [Tidjanibacter sp.]
MRRITLVVLTIFALCLPVQANDNSRGGLSYEGFMGGMMLHCGWASVGSISVGTSAPQQIKGLPLGIGGALKLRFGDHLRVGTEGYSSALTYGTWNSSLSIGWGGLLVDWSLPMGRFAPYAGVTVGGGVVKNITLSSTPAQDTLPEENFSYRQYGVGVVVPFVGVDYALTPRMSLTFKADRMIALSDTFDFPGGIRCYVGFLFSH